MNSPDKALLAPWPYPRWIAHRGAGKLAPENTLAAFRLGAAHGFRMFECDVKLSADGEPFLLHDADLSRTTSGHGVAGERRWDELSKLDAGGWHSPPYAGEPLLRLEALARWLQANRLMVNLEIKPSPGQDALTGAAVAREAARWWSGQAVQPLLSSFSVEALRAAQNAAPDLPRALLLEELKPGWLDTALDLACVAVVGHHPHLNADNIAQAHSAGFKVLTYTVNDVERADALWAAGLDGLITDSVDKLGPDRP
ncbi:MAG: glycerophosphodiester phosphodiesterase [Aquabacterium sp.]|uniref:glycerophosphodiester phosphodiesterase n=1 Tax=Aquabacterium sp. TaxID=1872578 RepID=UPI00271F11F4|nr:glycerophosphodiester phosphodiesterase [Aquabacterium sp.]MDO9006259.1 glycerophosphodiester phosphodiesterase [Aquabacterium sp.]